MSLGVVNLMDAVRASIDAKKTKAPTPTIIEAQFIETADNQPELLAL